MTKQILLALSAGWIARRVQNTPNDSNGQELIHVQPAASVSPNGRYRIETYGVDKSITYGGLYPSEEIRLIELPSGKELWKTAGFYQSDFKWSPDSRFVAMTNWARTFSEITILDVQDPAHVKEIKVPWIYDIEKKTPIQIPQNRPDPYFVVKNWIDNTSIAVDFQWVPKVDFLQEGHYVFNVLTGQLSDLRVSKPKPL